MRIAFILLAACGASTPTSQPASPMAFDGERVLSAIHDVHDVERACAATEREMTRLRQATDLAGVQAFDRATTIAGTMLALFSTVHPDEKVRSAADACSARLGALSDAAAPALLSRVENQHSPYVERMRIGAFLVGGTLDASHRARFAELSKRESELKASMGQADSTAPASVVIDASRIADMPRDFVAAHPVEGGKVRLDPVADWHAIGTLAHDRALATELMTARRAVSLPNVPRLRELLDVRHEMATLLGCASYLDCQARKRMVGTAERIRRFDDELVKLLDDLAPTYLATVGITERSRPPQADLDFLEHAARERAGIPDAAPYLEYFEVAPTVRRLLDAVGDATGLRFDEVNVNAWAPDVFAFDVSRHDRRIGRIYFDLYLRAGKFPGSGMSFPLVPHTPGHASEPVTIAVVATLPLPRQDHPSYFPTADDLGGLLHELGHAIDFLFETQSELAPPESDFFDVPSQLFEAWLTDTELLQRLGRKGGTPLPAAGAAAISVDLQWERYSWVRVMAALALIDTAYHGPTPAADPNAAHADAYERVLPVHVDRATHAEAGLFIPTIAYAGQGHALPWGLAISMELSAAFPHGLNDPATWSHLFDNVFTTNDTPAAERVERFLGRPWTLAALRAHLLPPLTK